MEQGGYSQQWQRPNLLCRDINYYSKKVFLLASGGELLSIIDILPSFRISPRYVTKAKNPITRMEPRRGLACKNNAQVSNRLNGKYFDTKKFVVLVWANNTNTHETNTIDR